MNRKAASSSIAIRIAGALRAYFRNSELLRPKSKQDEFITLTPELQAHLNILCSIPLQELIDIGILCIAFQEGKTWGEFRKIGNAGAPGYLTAIDVDANGVTKLGTHGRLIKVEINISALNRILRFNFNDEPEMAHARG